MKLPKKIWHEIQVVAQFACEGDMGKKYKLNFSLLSIRRLDNMIDYLWEGEHPRDLNGMVWLFGCYLAIVIDSKFNGTWCIDKKTQEISFRSATTIFTLCPWNWVAKRFEGEESLADKTSAIFQLIKSDRLKSFKS